MTYEYGDSYEGRLGIVPMTCVITELYNTNEINVGAYRFHTDQLPFPRKAVNLKVRENYHDSHHVCSCHV